VAFGEEADERQVAALGGDVAPYVPRAVADYLAGAMTP